MNFKVEISGQLKGKNGGIVGAQVLLSYSVNVGQSWINLTTALTDGNGRFSEVWIPQVSGSYLLRATYLGDANYEQTISTVNFIIMPFADQNVFSVTSNSTVTALSFDSSTQMLSFKVNGPSNTTGYVSVYIPKSLVMDASTLKVYFDGESLTYTAIPQQDAVLITLTYHHSMHEVVVHMNQQRSAEQNMYVWIIASVSALCASVVFIIALKKRSSKSS